METVLLVILGVVAAFAAAYGAVAAIGGWLRREGVVLSAQGCRLSLPNLVGLRFQGGIGPLMPLASYLAEWRPAAKMGCEAAAFARSRGWHASVPTALSVLLAGLLAVLVAVWMLTGQWTAAMAAMLCCAVVAGVAAEGAADRRRETVRQEVPDVLELMSACFGSGFTLLQTFQQVARDVKGPLGKLFERSAHCLETGGGVSEALDILRCDESIPELGFVIAALDIQHQSGGAVGPVLASASKSVKGELALRRSLQVQTAQARLSARVVTVMPFILIAIFCMVSPDFLQPFFSGPAGYALLALALLMQAAGVILVQRALNVEGVS